MQLTRAWRVSKLAASARARASSRRRKPASATATVLRRWQREKKSHATIAKRSAGASKPAGTEGEAGRVHAFQ